MSELLKNIDARTKLAGTNKLESCCFSSAWISGLVAGKPYGINVFKVREGDAYARHHGGPDMPPSVEDGQPARRWCRDRSGQVFGHCADTPVKS